MAWKVIDRNQPVVDRSAPPVLSEAVRAKIKAFFPRYETKRAVLLPALHVVQNTLGHVPWHAMVEVADLLDIHPSDVIDTISFYTHFWTHPKGERVVTVCRSVSCEVMGSVAVLNAVKNELGIDEHGTTPDGKYSLVTEECLAGCDHAPCLLINERLHKRVKPEDVKKLLSDPANDRVEMDRSDLFDPPAANASGGNGQAGTSMDAESLLETTSDVKEMMGG